MPKRKYLKPEISQKEINMFINNIYEEPSSINTWDFIGYLIQTNQLPRNEVKKLAPINDLDSYEEMFGLSDIHDVSIDWLESYGLGTDNIDPKFYEYVKSYLNHPIPNSLG